MATTMTERDENTGTNRTTTTTPALSKSPDTPSKPTSHEATTSTRDHYLIQEIRSALDRR